MLGAIDFVGRQAALTLTSDFVESLDKVGPLPEGEGINAKPIKAAAGHHGGKTETRPNVTLEVEPINRYRNSGSSLGTPS
jgi:hypothetical protein